MRLKIALCLVCLTLLISACDIFPYTLSPATRTPTTAPSPSPQPPEPAQPTPTLPGYPILEPSPIPEDDTEDNSEAEEPFIEAAFSLQEGAPFYLPNFNHPAEGCGWMGLAGQVFAEDDTEILGLTVIAGNINDGEENASAAITGLSTAYGLGGYEIQLANIPVESTATYWVQVFDQDGEPLTAKLFFNTYEDCEQNLILINFVAQDNQDAP